jgi:hypothetical protein
MPTSCANRVTDYLFLNLATDALENVTPFKLHNNSVAQKTRFKLKNKTLAVCSDVRRELGLDFTIPFLKEELIFIKTHWEKAFRVELV